MIKRKTKLMIFLVFAFLLTFFCGGRFALASVRGETDYEYLQTSDTTFTNGEVILLTHERSGVTYALANEGGYATPYEVTVSGGKIVSSVSDAMLWKVEFYNGFVRFSSLEDGKYLTVNATEIVTVASYGASGSVNFQNSTTLHAGDYYLMYGVPYRGYSSSARAITFSVFKRSAVSADADTATVSFSAGEGTGEMESKTVDVGSSFVLPECGFTKADHSFAYWTDGVNRYAAGETVSIVGDTLFTAVFEPKHYEIRFHDGDAVYKVEQVLSSETGFSVSALGIADPVKKGWAFVGWKLGETLLSDDEVLPISADTDLYAYYTVGYVYRASVSLAGDIALNFYMELDEATLKNADAKLRFVFKGKTTETPLSDGVLSMIDGNAYYKFTFHTAAKDYAMPVSLAVSLPDAVGTEYTYSVKDYAERLLAATDETLTAVKPLVRSMLTYCIAANDYFYGGEVSSDNTGVTLSDLSAYKTTAEGILDEGVSVLGATLVLDTVARIRIYFEAASAVVCKVDGNEVTAQAVEGEPNRYYVEIDNVSAKNLDRTYSVEIGSFKIGYCALGYAYSVLEQTSSPLALVVLVKTMYLYNQAANEYFNS